MDYAAWIAILLITGVAGYLIWKLPPTDEGEPADLRIARAAVMRAQATLHRLNAEDAGSEEAQNLLLAQADLLDLQAEYLVGDND